MSQQTSPQGSPIKEEPGEPQSPASPSHPPAEKIESEEDIPEAEYQEMLAAMEAKKKADEENKVEGRETFDYSVPKRRKKQKTDEPEPEKMLDPMAVDWMKSKLQTLSGFDDNKHWNMVQEPIRNFLTNPEDLKMFVWTEGDSIKLDSQIVHSLESDDEFIFFLKTSKQPVDSNNINDVIFTKKVQSNHLKSLLTVMNSHFIPKLLKDDRWPQNVKKEFLAQLHKFMSTLTETCYEMQGYTELYIPNEQLTNVDGQDKDLIQRLQATIINWNKQIRQIVNNTDSQHENESSGPLDEINYWRRRRENLKHIDEQLEKPELKEIVKFLERMDSTYAKGFTDLTLSIKHKTEEASNNLQFLQSLFQPCKALETATPKQIPELLPNLLMRVRMIWEHSKYYKSNDRISGLLHKISNEIIKRCKEQINVDDMLEGDVEKCIQDLKDSITCGRKWQAIYDKMASTISKKYPQKWDFSLNSIFAQVQAFVQRCSELIEICEGQLQFAMRGSDMQMPKFGGSRSGQIINILLEIKASFRKLIDKFRSSEKQRILDVKASTWHDQYNSFKAGMKELDVMYQNVIDYSFKQMTTVEQGVELLEAFDYLAKRDSIKACVNKKVIDILNLFMAEVEAAKHEHQQRKNMQYPLHHGKYSGHAILVRSLLFRMEKLKQSIDKLYFVDDAVKAPALEKYNITYKNLESVIKEQKLNGWKEENKIYEDKSNLNKGIENITILRRPEENDDDYKMVDLLKPKPFHIECNFDRKLLKLMHEVNAWKILIPFNVRVPNDSDEFVQTNQQNLRVLRQYSMIVVRDYNAIINFMDDTEKKLFAEQLEATDKVIQPGIARYKWSSKNNVDSFLSRSCKMSCSQLYSKLKMFKSNTEKIEAKCEEIASKLLININKKKAYVISQFEREQEKHRQEVLMKIKSIFEEIFQILCATYEPFVTSRRDTQLVWFSYVKMIDSKIEEALKKAVKNSLVELYRVIGDQDKGIPSVPVFILEVGLDQTDNPKSIYNPPIWKLIQTITNTISSMNQVVQSLEMMQQRMLRVYKHKKEEIAQKLQKEKNPLKKVVEEEEIKIPEESYFVKISDDRDIQKYASRILGSFESVCKHVVKDDSKDNWINSHLTWSEARRDKLIKDWVSGQHSTIITIHDVIKSFDEQSQQIQSIRTTMPMHCIVLDNSPFKHKLSELMITWQNLFLQHLQQHCVEELKDIHEKFRSAEASLTPQPQDLHELKHISDLWEDLTANKEKLFERIAPVKDKLAELDEHSIQLKEDEIKLRETLMDGWKNYVNMLAEMEKRNQKVRSHFQHDTTKNLEEFLKDTSDLKVQFNSNAPFQSNLQNEKAFSVLNEYTENVKVLRHRWQDMKFGFDLFDISYPAPGDLDSVDKEIKNLENIWGLKEEWDRKYQNAIKDIHFKNVNFDDLQNLAADYIWRLGDFSKQAYIRKWDTTTAFKTSLENFKAVIPLIRALRENYMRDRHWNELRKTLQFDHESPTFTIDEIFVQKNFLAYADIINNVCSNAEEEFKIEDALAKIKAAWNGFEMTLENYKNTKKIIQTDKFFTALQEHMGVLSNLKTGIHFDSFKDDIEFWEQRLQQISETLDQLIQVQRQWIYLDAIFASQQDQDKQLIGDFNKFLTLSNRLSTHMKRIERDAMRKLIPSLLVQDFLEDLQDISKRLDESQKVLFSLLERKRRDFPRFYFLANDDLFELLGNSKDPVRVNKHIKKCFEGIAKLNIQTTAVASKKVEHNIFDVIELVSPEEEIVRLSQKVLCQNGVENWIKNVEASMRDTLRKLLNQTHADFPRKKDPKLIADWVENHIGQLLITTCQIYWTSDCQSILKQVATSQKPDKSKIWKPLKDQKSFFLVELTKLVRKASDNLVTRLKLIALITIEVHARDITDILSKTCFSPNSFEWKKQLRFTCKNDGDMLHCFVEQTNTKFPYGYEYQGNNGRLVVTSLTDRCYMTLTTAMHLKKGGAPQGPAGTGKTETVKDLGKGMAKFVLVFNCSEGLDYKSLGRMFSGLIQTGGWGCFDQFNRIEVEVLSVVAQQMQRILQALRDLQNHPNTPEQPFNFQFEDATLPANQQCAIFITMNPGYAGRSELPDNLKSLFRPISMMIPESSIICQIMLSSEGFKFGRILSTKMVVLYSLMSQQLSKQDHYDFGLRAIKSVLTCAGAIRRAVPSEPEVKIDKKDKEALKEQEEKEEMQEILILMKAIKDMNLPKFVVEDTSLFNSLFQDLFPNIELQESDDEIFVKAIRDELVAAGLVVKNQQVRKIIQLYDSKNTRHGNMLVGCSMSGKSTCWKILKNTMNNLNKKLPKQYPAVKSEVLNPKTVDLKELFGCVDANLEWSEGVLSSMMSRLCKDESDAQRWMILDGPVDTLWIESMNTVLDDNKVLTLLNGDRISLPPQVGLVFEVEDLAVASPATVSRAGMVYLNINDVGWRAIMQAWILKIKDQQVQEFLSDTVQKWFPKLFAKKKAMKEYLKEIVPVLDSHIVLSFTKLMNVFVQVEAKSIGFTLPNKAETYWNLLQKWFTFCVIWSFGATLDETGHKHFDSVIREIESMFPSNLTVYDYYINNEKNEWAGWEQKINATIWKPPPNCPFHKMLVPTVDSARNRFILMNCVQHKVHTLSIGVTGTGKTVLINEILSELDESIWKTMNIIFSSQTSSLKTQQAIEGKLVKRAKTKMVPDGKKMVIYVDDLNMPKKDTFGSQPPLQLIRQWMDYQGWFDRQQREIFKKIEDIQFISSMGPPGGGRAQISRRVITKFNIINFTFPSESQVRRIYQTILTYKFQTQEFEDEIKPLAETLSIATINLYQAVSENFLPTPAKSHYVFNMRDISKVIQGIYVFDKFYCDSKITMYRLWVHECLRVFHDRLVSTEDRLKLKKLISEQLELTLQSSMKQCTDENETDTIFVDFFDESQPRQIYIEVPYKQRDQLRKLAEERLAEYNAASSAGAMNIVIFEEALSYICKIHRIIKFSRGHGMLVGEGGAGRHSLTKLACHIAKYRVHQISTNKNYRLREFRENIREWLIKDICDDVPSVLIFSDNQITQQAFVEDINTILTIGEIPNLFGKDDYGRIKDGMRKMFMRTSREARDMVLKDEFLLDQFFTRVQNNFHIMFLISKAGDNLRNYCRMYPGLVNNTTMIWFMPWPNEALVEVANQSLSKLPFDEETRKAVSSFFGNAHTKVLAMADKMLRELKRLYYVTPTNYIELVKGYVELLKDKQDEIGGEINKLSNGLFKLDEAQLNSNQLQKSLGELQNELNKKSKDCQELLFKMDKETKESKDRKNEVSEREIQVNKEKAEIQILKADAEADLKKAEPALAAAEMGLANLTKDKLSVVKSYTTPPAGVDVVLNAVMLLINREPNWAVAKKQLADTSFLAKLQGIDKARIPVNTLKRIEKLTQDPKMSLEKIDTISEAAGGLWRWVLAIEGYAKAYKDIEPKKIKCNNLQEKLKNSENQLNKLREKFESLRHVIEELSNTLETAKADMAGYQKQAQQLHTKLERAQKLINGLASTKQGWHDRKKKLEEKYGNLIGDALMSAAFLSYAGPFPSEYREAFVKDELLGYVKVLKIPHSKDYNFPEFLVKPVEFIKWQLKGLPDDQFSRENGVLVKKGRMFPLLIDPQQQGNKWIKEMEKDQGKDQLKILDPQADNFMSSIVTAANNGKVVIFQNLEEDVDVALETMLSKAIRKPGGGYRLFGDTEWKVLDTFRLYMTTKLANPKFKAEMTTRVTLVNFTVKEKGLQEQLNSVVIRKMEAQLENNKNELIKNKSDNEEYMRKLDDDILRILGSTKGNLIDDADIIGHLQSSKETEQKVRHQIESSATQMKKINAARENYRKLAKIASKLFFIINDFSLIEPMYQFALDAYIGLFEKTIKEYLDKPGLNDALQQKLDAIAERHKTAAFRYACRGLFEKDKLLLGLMMTVKLKQIDEQEYNFFLRGSDNTIDRKGQVLNQNDWIDQASWNAICDLDKLPNFTGIIGAFTHNARQWKRWYMSALPEKEPLPGEWNEKCDGLRKMIITKIIRRDRVLPAAINFIVEKNGSDTFVNPPSFSLESVFNDSNKTTPIIFVLSPGVDPYSQLDAFAKSKGVSFFDVSLGQGQARKAKEKILEGAKNGTWLYLANCHLSLNFLKELEKILETLEMTKENVLDSFRLWLSTNPHPKFPISILQKCIKVTTEPPKGVKANMLRLYSTMPKELGSAVKENKVYYKRSLFALCWFHSLIIERKRFKTLGWNIIYDFNDSDFETADKILQLYIDQTQEIKTAGSSITGEAPVVIKTPPWDAIRYLIAEVTYGGRVTDEWDRRLLNVYASEFFNQKVVSEDKHRLGDPNLNEYIIPEELGPREKNLQKEGQAKYYFKKIMDEFPSTERPEAFGQHINAQISSQIADTNALLESIMTLQSRQSKGGDDSVENRVKEIIKDLLERVDLPFDMEEVIEKVKPEDQNPLKIVLIQQITRYNKLLSTVRKNLADLDKGISGLVLISEDLELIMKSLYENKVPLQWKFAYYSLKPLNSWIIDLNKRIDQLRNWVNKGQPDVFWISGFSFPTGFTTALQQQASRKLGESIDKFTWQFSFQKMDTSISAPAKEGAYIEGLFLEGAKWDGDRNCIAEAEPMKLYYKMPIIQFKPVLSETKQKAKKGQNFYQCPTYMYPIRTGIKGPSYMFTVQLPYKPNPNFTGTNEQDFWIKRGTALLMSLAGDEV